MPKTYLHLFFKLYLNRTSEKMNSFSLDLGQVPGTPSGYDYSLVENMGDLADIDVLYVMGRYGLEVELKSGWYVTAAFEHYNYDDRSPYLFDGTGNMYRVAAGAGYRF